MLSRAAVGTWLAGFGSAFSIKLSSSIDDVVWLAPFLTANSSTPQRTWNALIYISVCVVQTLVAKLIALSGNTVVGYLTAGAKDAWSTEKILTVSAGCMLAVYSVKLTYESVQECREGAETDEDRGSDNKYNKVATEDGGDAESGLNGMKKGSRGSLSARNREIEHAEDGDPSRVTIANEEGRSQALFVIAFIGSVDDLTLFVPMLVGKGFDIVQLVTGGFIAATTIVVFCVFIGLCKPIADCLSKIPLALIVVIFAVVLLVRGSLMH